MSIRKVQTKEQLINCINRLEDEKKKLQFIRDAQLEEIRELRQEIEALKKGHESQELKQAYEKIEQQEQEIKKLLTRRAGHNKGKAGRPTVNNELISEINRLRDAGMSYKKISHELNISVATAYKYSQIN